MRHIGSMILALVCAVAIPAALHAQGQRTDITGKWSFSVQSEAGSGTPVVTFKQVGDSVSGRYSSQALGERDFTGSFKNGKIDFGFSAEAGGQQFSMSFAGTMDGADSMKGSVNFGGMATGTFTAKRQKP